MANIRYKKELERNAQPADPSTSPIQPVSLTPSTSLIQQVKQEKIPDVEERTPEEEKKTSSEDLSSVHTSQPTQVEKAADIKKTESPLQQEQPPVTQTQTQTQNQNQNQNESTDPPKPKTPTVEVLKSGTSPAKVQ